MVSPALRKLARSYGVQTNYSDVDGRRIDAEPEVLVTVLRTLGASIEHAQHARDAEEALQRRRRASCQRMLEPVTAIWDGDTVGVRMVFPAGLSSKSFKATLYLEDGQERDWSPSARTLVRARTVDGTRYLWTRLPLPSLPHGYHRLHVSMGNVDAETFIIRAPTRAYRDPGRGKRWGLFAPLYALHSKRSAGIGDFGDLRRFAELTLAYGGRFIATLPLLASYPDEPSPYSPASRLFWNELYVDDSTASPETPSQLLDYPELYAAKRNALQPGRASDVADFQARFPLALDYARFRAAAQAHGTNWTRWPDKLRDGLIEEAEPDVDDDAVRYHLYSQMLAEEQIAEIAAGNTELYFDLPLGVHRFGYDTWREQTLFAHEVDVGAPPDTAFPGGQNWSFPPVRPQKTRLQHHRHLRLVYRHAMRHADILRIDHVMGLHRQFWIPRRASVADGVYVRYPAEELYATLNIESHRARCELVGENVGLVPDVVTENLARHGFRGLYVAQLTPDAPIPTSVVASLNTHDTELFATTEDDLEPALQKLLKSAADIVSVTLEDLWHETRRQNVPGTKDEHPNWRRPLRYALEELDARVGATLDSFARD